MAFNTEQEAFWAGEFGNEYSLRNQGKAARVKPGFLLKGVGICAQAPKLH